MGFDHDIIVVGAGPAGLIAGYYLAKSGGKTTVLEKRLSIGGGIWAGAAGYSVITAEDRDILDEIGVTVRKQRNLYVVDAIEFATALGYKAKKAGVEIFNLTEAEDIILKKDVVDGVVVNGARPSLAINISSRCESNSGRCGLLNKVALSRVEVVCFRFAG